MVGVIVLSFQTPTCRYNISEPYEDSVLDQQHLPRTPTSKGWTIILRDELLRLKSFLRYPN